MLVSFMIDVLTGKPQKVDMVIPAVTEAGEPTTKRITVEKTPEVRDRIAAAQWLGDRGWGRAIQQVDFTQSKPFIIQHRQFPPGHDPLAEPVDAESVSIVPVKALEEQR